MINPSPIHTATPESLTQLSFPLDAVPAGAAPDLRHLKTPRKTILAVHTYPIAGSPSLLARKILHGLAEHARISYAKFSEDERRRIHESRGTPLFRIRVSDLRAMLEQSNRDTQRVHDAIATIYQWDIQWEVVSGHGDDAKVVESFKSRVISNYGVGSKREFEVGTISFEFPYDVLQFMLEQRPRTQIDLRVINSLGSGYAVALYDLCAPYFGTPQRVTPLRPVGDWITILVGANKYSGQGQYKDFKRYVIKPAIAWLEKVESCPFTVEVEEQSVARGRVTHLQFRLVAKEQTMLDLDTPPLTWSPELCEVLIKVYAFSPADLATAASTHTEAEIAEAIERDRLLHQAGKGSDRAAVPRHQYLMALVKNVQLGRPRTSEPDVEDLYPPSSNVTRARDRAKRLRERFHKERNTKLVDRLDRVQGSRLDTLRSVFTEHMGAGLVGADLSPAVIQRGWRKGNKPMWMAFAQWLAAREPELLVELLPRPEEHDFSVWLLLNQDSLDNDTAADRGHPNQDARAPAGVARRSKARRTGDPR